LTGRQYAPGPGVAFPFAISARWAFEKLLRVELPSSKDFLGLYSPGPGFLALSAIEL